MADISSILVKLEDGSVWEAEYNSGKLQLINEISPPEKPKPAVTPKDTYTPVTTYREDILEKLVRESKEILKDKLSEPKEKPKEEEKPSPPPPIPDSVFRERLRSIMTDNMYDRHVRGRTRGKLDLTRLWKGETGATTLFTQKQARKNKKYNVLLLVDESGSMGDGPRSKMAVASEATVFLAQSFQGININLAIVGFNAYIKVHKGFDEKMPDLKLLGQVITVGTGGEDNNDYDALSYAYKMFPEEGENILVMMSDGEPAPTGDWGYIQDESNWKGVMTEKDELGKRYPLWFDTSFKGSRRKKKSFHDLVAKHPDVTSIGIGILEGGWQIPDHKVIKNLKELKPVILAELTKKIRRG